VYENRGEKLGLRRIDLNDAIAEKVEEADLDPDQVALLERLLGKDYEVITADDRLDQVADDIVEHCSKRWESGKAMLVCIDAYNRDKDRISVEEAFVQLLEFSDQLDAEQRRTAEEGLTEEERALFDMLSKDDLSKTDRETLKQASKGLLASLERLLAPMNGWTGKEQTRAEVEVFILDRLFEALPGPPYTEDETQAAAARIYDYVWQRSATGGLFGQPAA